MSSKKSSQIFQRICVLCRRIRQRSCYHTTFSLSTVAKDFMQKPHHNFPFLNWLSSYCHSMNSVVHKGNVRFSCFGLKKIMTFQEIKSRKVLLLTQRPILTSFHFNMELGLCLHRVMRSATLRHWDWPYYQNFFRNSDKSSWFKHKWHARYLDKNSYDTPRASTQ